MREVELFQPVSDFFRGQDFEVQGEVRGCDLVATRGEEIVAVELKLRPNLDLVLQTSERLRSYDQVYACFPAGSASRKTIKRVYALWKRLGVGVLLVHFTRSGHQVEVAVPARSWEERRNQRERRRIRAEVDLRKIGTDTGGTTGSKILTAYRERALELAVLLQRTGPTSPKALREQGASPKSGAILYSNHYGWFVRESKGLYGLSESGTLALREYRDVASVLEQQLGLE